VTPGAPPNPRAELVGSDRDETETVEKVLALLRSHTRWVTLTGLPGIGTSSVAFAVARAWNQDHGVCRVIDAAELTVYRRAAQADALNCDLLVIDGLSPTMFAFDARADIGRERSLADGAADARPLLPLLVDWLAARPDRRILATSHVPLGVPDEATLRVRGRSEAWSVDWLRARVDKASDSDLAWLAHAAEGHPLVLRVLARRASLVGVERVRAQVESVNLTTPSALYGGPVLEASIRSVIDTLDPAAHTVLSLLALLDGGATIDTLDEVLRQTDGTPRDEGWIDDALDAANQLALVERMDATESAPTLLRSPSLVRRIGAIVAPASDRVVATACAVVAARVRAWERTPTHEGPCPVPTATLLSLAHHGAHRAIDVAPIQLVVQQIRGLGQQSAHIDTLATRELDATADTRPEETVRMLVDDARRHEKRGALASAEASLTRASALVAHVDAPDACVEVHMGLAALATRRLAHDRALGHLRLADAAAQRSPQEASLRYRIQARVAAIHLATGDTTAANGAYKAAYYGAVAAADVPRQRRYGMSALRAMIESGSRPDIAALLTEMEQQARNVDDKRWLAALHLARVDELTRAGAISEAHEHLDAIESTNTEGVTAPVATRRARLPAAPLQRRLAFRQRRDDPNDDATSDTSPLRLDEACLVQGLNGETADLRRRRVLRAILHALIKARGAHPGRALDTNALIRAGWPEQRVVDDAALNRLYVSIRRLRSLVGDAVIEARDDGYLIPDAIEVVIEGDDTPTRGMSGR